MKKVYGNHLGLVISGGDEDPEQRGRCQIFIPHISNTLFKGWNDKLEDINFTNMDTGVLSPDMINRLKATLPWSECASPIFGGGTGAFYNPVTGVVKTEFLDTLPEDNK